MSEDEEFEFRLRHEREQAQSSEPFAKKVGRQVLNAGAGAIRGAGSIGATLLAPIDIAKDALDGKGLSLESNRQRRRDMTEGLGSLGADTDSAAFKGGALLTEVAGTLGAGGAIANGLARAPGLASAAPGFLNAVRTGGMAAGAGSGAGNAITRAAGGAVTGGASAGLADPENAAAGAAVGGALPGIAQGAAKAGNAIGAAVRGGGPSSSVGALADRAKALGIDIPADRLVDSKPMNALAATLNYVPFSGRAATEGKMAEQMNTALSRTFGQNTSNVTQALRSASGDLGQKFDTVLQANSVKLTPRFQQALADAENQATSELGQEGASIIHKQIATIQAKAAATGEIDGQAAYNIKKTLDRIGSRNSPEAFYARDLKRSLMDALNDSLGPQQAADFGGLRRQYGNMLALENLAQNGAEGGVSIARLANLKNINNPELQELADIAAQFLRSRESPHGAMQRLVIGGAASTAGGLSALPILAGTAAAGRAANAGLNSNAARNFVLGRTNPNAIQQLVMDPRATQLGYRAAPIASTDR